MTPPITESLPENESYMTPKWVIKRLLDVWSPPGGVAVEPAVGEGAIVRTLQDRHKQIGEWLTYDIRNVAPLAGLSVPVAHYHSDYLLAPGDIQHHAKLVITNPPFSLADKFILKARRNCPYAELVFLLRLGFLASQERVSLWREVGEPDLWIYLNRPSYVSKKPGRLDTDKYDYGWFIWPPGKRSQGAIGHLALTSLEERKLG